MQTAIDELSSLKCRYASKRCWNLRAIKRNGERHNLCEMHRQKANSNQRRLDKKRKAGQSTLGLPDHLGPSKLSDLERRMRMRASIALKLEHELVIVPLTTQYICRPSVSELQRAAEYVAMGSGRSTSCQEMNLWDNSSSRLSSAAWMNASYPRSPRAMLRVAKMEPSVEAHAWMHRNQYFIPKPEPVVAPQLLPPIATAVARSGEGLINSTVLQSSLHPEVRRGTSLVKELQSVCE
ncbi:uncharacterized protein PHALS_03519 [Plasmopara halstedii]|uniref:Uncharacterized protein n=1 Tax=Plasmopara halstedii TaxID=4781 RepID=A0A0P1AZR2_PLAHL|nr:uncharacterized protein PHALS_03519 [Plasmopara halstedii]CEG46842.1 hypothetical protein PHALS_03519 [Plasmopara halstedii]|eukprot:XP_024583211.1 hypothetical protein PHALS_03519 [Plasmopara halstedii]